MATFYARYEKALRQVGDRGGRAGRLQGDDRRRDSPTSRTPPITQTAKAQYELFGPGDVQRLAAGAITRRFPAPNASDAEVTKLALVEFAAPDLPWRYTPQLAGATALRPWLVLVVGQRAPDDIVLRPDGRVTLGLVAQSNHMLSRVGAVGARARGRRTSRSPGSSRRRARRWRGAATRLPRRHRIRRLRRARVHGRRRRQLERQRSRSPAICYDWWTFRTGPQGDFHELAAKLHKADLAAIEQPAASRSAAPR